MKRVVVDASVAIKWFVPEIHSDAAARLLEPGLSLCAPDLILAELGNVVWKKKRRGELTPEKASEILMAFIRFDVDIQPSDRLVPAALMLASALDRTVYDTLYLTLAIARDGVLITADRRFHLAVTESGLGSYIGWIEDEL